MRLENPLIKVLFSLIIAVATYILTFIIAYNIFLIFDPPYITDGGVNHPVMPIGPALFGTFFAIICSIISLYICYKRFKTWKK